MMLKKLVNILYLLFANAIMLSSQNSFVQKNIPAHYKTENIAIDGNLNESDWKIAVPATGFKSVFPVIGKASKLNTEVYILYDNMAIYIGAVLFDHPDSISNELSVRDYTQGNSDRFFIHILPYNDGQNIFQFEISTANVQKDVKISNNVPDLNWNAIWESAVKHGDYGWSLEMRIPFSAIRFPETKEQIWGFNCFRYVNRQGELSSWSPIDRTKGEWGPQAGSLNNIKDIKAPFRLYLFPYLSSSFQNSPQGNSYSYSAGMDLQYGINENFTLDMTMVPDFGQTKSDFEILNLSPFEVRYDENRQFFSEGMDLFKKTNIFYSRRVGKRPTGYYSAIDSLNEGDKMIKNPEESQLLNAVKITGRDNQSNGLAFFNAITADTYADIKRNDGSEKRLKTESGKNYNMIVFDKIIGKYSYLNVANSNVFQPENSRLANVAATAFKMATKNNTYSFFGRSAVSHIQENISSNNTGIMSNLTAGKSSGRVNYLYNFVILTDKYDINDMGYQNRSNYIQHGLVLKYAEPNPGKKLLNWQSEIELKENTLYTPMIHTGIIAEASARTTFINYYSFGYNIEAAPKNYDYYEPRTEGRFYIVKPYYWHSIFISSDYRKPLSTSLFFGYGEGEGKYPYFSVLFNYKVNNRFILYPSFNYESALHEIGFADKSGEDTIYFGRRDKKNLSANVKISYVFNTKNALSINFRHYWSVVEYFQFYSLNPNGSLSENNKFMGNIDKNYNAVNLDVFYSWNFAPGSFFTVAYKNSILPDEAVTNNQFYNYGQNLKYTFGSSQTNSVSLKLSYYLDYKYLTKIKS